MKKFILSVLSVAVFFVGVGSLVEKAGAKFKSDDKALELVRKARLAIGGDAAIANIRSLRIVGQTTRTFTADGAARNVTGETEIAMQLPDKFMKMTKLGHGDGVAGPEQMQKQIDVIVKGDGVGEKHVFTTSPDGPADGNGVQKIVIKKSDGTTQELTGAEAEKFRVQNGDGGTATFKIEDNDGDSNGKQVMIRRVGGDGDFAAHHDGMRQNEMLRLTLALLMSAPEGQDVDYQLGGDGDVDGTSCNILVAAFGGNSFRIFLNKNTNLPMMLSYTGPKMPVIRLRTPANPGQDSEKLTNVVIERNTGSKTTETAEFNVKFSDYRVVNGVQLPYKWTQTVGGNPDESFEVSSYEVNPANIADKFKNNNVMYKVRKPADQ